MKIVERQVGDVVILDLHGKILIGEGDDALREAVTKLAAAGEKVGLLTVRLYRPFDTQAFVKALPKTVRSIAVLDRMDARIDPSTATTSFSLITGSTRIASIASSVFRAFR